MMRSAFRYITWSADPIFPNRRSVSTHWTASNSNDKRDIIDKVDISDKMHILDIIDKVYIIDIFYNLYIYDKVYKVNIRLEI